jgi:hypothetical protein
VPDNTYLPPYVYNHTTRTTSTEGREYIEEEINILFFNERNGGLYRKFPGITANDNK